MPNAQSKTAIEGHTIRFMRVHGLLATQDMHKLLNQDACFVAGLSRSGKSTMLGFFMGLNIRRDEENIIMDKVPNMPLSSDGCESATMHCRLYQFVDQLLIDTPGFFDTRSEEQAKWTRYTLGAALSLVSRFRVVFVVNFEKTFKQGSTAHPMRELAQTIAKVTNNDPKIMQAMRFVFTHVAKYGSPTGQAMEMPKIRHHVQKRYIEELKSCVEKLKALADLHALSMGKGFAKNVSKMGKKILGGAGPTREGEGEEALPNLSGFRSDQAALASKYLAQMAQYKKKIDWSKAEKDGTNRIVEEYHIRENTRRLMECILEQPDDNIFLSPLEQGAIEKERVALRQFVQKAPLVTSSSLDKNGIRRPASDGQIEADIASVVRHLSSKLVQLEEALGELVKIAVDQNISIRSIKAGWETEKGHIIRKLDQDIDRKKRLIREIQNKIEMLSTSDDPMVEAPTIHRYRESNWWGRLWKNHVWHTDTIKRSFIGYEFGGSSCVPEKCSVVKTSDTEAKIELCGAPGQDLSAYIKFKVAKKDHQETKDTIQGLLEQIGNLRKEIASKKTLLQEIRQVDSEEQLLDIVLKKKPKCTADLIKEQHQALYELVPTNLEAETVPRGVTRMQAIRAIYKLVLALKQRNALPDADDDAKSPFDEFITHVEAYRSTRDMARTDEACQLLMKVGGLLDDMEQEAAADVDTEEEEEEEDIDTANAEDGTDGACKEEVDAAEETGWVEKQQGKAPLQAAAGGEKLEPADAASIPLATVCHEVKPFVGSYESKAHETAAPAPAGPRSLQELEAMSIDQLHDFLVSKNFTKLAPILKNADVDGEELGLCSEADVAEIIQDSGEKVRAAKIKKLFHVVSKIKNPESSVGK